MSTENQFIRPATKRATGSLKFYRKEINSSQCTLRGPKYRTDTLSTSSSISPVKTEIYTTHDSSIGIGAGEIMLERVEITVHDTSGVISIRVLNIWDPEYYYDRDPIPRNAYGRANHSRASSSGSSASGRSSPGTKRSSKRYVMVDKDGTLCVGDHPARFRAAMYNGRQTLVLEGEGISRRWRDHGPNQNWTCKPPTREDAKGDDSTIFMRFFADSDVHLQRGITGEVVRPENGFYLEYVDQRSLGSGLAAAAAAAAVEGW